MIRLRSSKPEFPAAVSKELFIWAAPLHLIDSQLIICINGKNVQLDREASLGELLSSLKIRVEGYTAVAINDEVIPKSMLSARKLRDGDRVEVIHAVAGG